MSTSKRHRFAVLAGVVAGTLLVAAYQAWQRRPSAIRNFHEWGPALAVFARERSFTPTTAAHELYHVLATRWSLRGTPQATRRPGAASSYEEAAAELYAECGVLLANETLPRKALERNRVTIKDPVLGDRVFEGVLTGDELVGAFDSLRNGANGAGFIGFGPLLANTMLDQVFAGADAITLESPQGATLVALCKDAAADPFAIEARVAGLLPSAVDADVSEAPAD